MTQVLSLSVIEDLLEPVQRAFPNKNITNNLIILNEFESKLYRFMEGMPIQIDRIQDLECQISDLESELEQARNEAEDVSSDDELVEKLNTKIIHLESDLAYQESLVRDLKADKGANND